MLAKSHSSSELLAALLYGAVKKGAVLSRRDLRFGDYVVTLTVPGAPRVPNGIECRAEAAPRARVAIGRGSLLVGRLDISPGPEWNPVPLFEPIAGHPAGPEPLSSSLATWMSPALRSDYALVGGYVAGLVLIHGMRKRAEQIAQRVARDSEPIAATVLRHAARGEVGEPVHRLFESRDPAPLLTLSPSGMLWLRGLISAGFPFEPSTLLVSPDLRKLA